MPRKTMEQMPDDESEPPASMRPRPDAAENARATSPTGTIPPASMRPRPDAAENAGQRRRDFGDRPLQ